jgi:hypothetical protein
MATATRRRVQAKRNPNARYEVWSGFPNLDRPGITSQHECRKFEWRSEALRYATSLPDDAQHSTVNITAWYASTGWQSQAIWQRRSGVWVAVDGTPLSDERIARGWWK